MYKTSMFKSIIKVTVAKLDYNKPLPESNESKTGALTIFRH